MLKTTLLSFKEAGIECYILSANEKMRSVLLSALNDVTIESSLRPPFQEVSLGTEDHNTLSTVIPLNSALLLDKESEISEASEEEFINQNTQHENSQLKNVQVEPKRD